MFVYTHFNLINDNTYLEEEWDCARSVFFIAVCVCQGSTLVRWNVNVRRCEILMLSVSLLCHLLKFEMIFSLAASAVQLPWITSSLTKSHYFLELTFWKVNFFLIIITIINWIYLIIIIIILYFTFNFNILLSCVCCAFDVLLYCVYIIWHTVYYLCLYLL